MPLTAVAFDLDYTLAVTDRSRSRILRDATAATGAPDLTREAYLAAHRRNLTGESREPIFADLLADHDADTDPETLARAYREAVADALEPVGGAVDLLDSLRASGYRLGLLTNGPVAAQRDKIETLGWEDRFDAALVTGELPAGKPDPRAFEALLDRLDVPAEEAVYVGDEVEADVEGATGVGIRAIQVLGPDAPDSDRDPRASAHVRRDDLARRLPEILAELDGTELTESELT